MTAEPPPSGIAETYRAYASLRGPVWTVARVLVAVGVVLLAARNELAVYAVVAVVLVDVHLRRALRAGRTADEDGLGRHGAAAHTAAGFLLGAVLIGVMIGVMWLAGWYRIRDVVWTDALLRAFVVFALVSVVEEVLARGLVFQWIERWAGTWWGLGVSSLAFGLLHVANPNASVRSGLAIALEAGVLLGAAYLVTRTLWFPIGIHWSWNLFEGPVFGTPVSGQDTASLLQSSVRGPEAWTGGAFGPEGGWVAVIVGTLSGVLLLALAVRRGTFSAVPGRERQGEEPASPLP